MLLRMVNAMQYVYPDYYKEFECIKGDCKHNCCIGWEIDIDKNTAEFYKTVKGEMGERLNAGVLYDDVPHFVLAENERCPFLNKDNLCDIIINLGEDKICDICKAHPRFINDYSFRVETGLGLCCEEAARLILSKKTKTVLETNGDMECFDEIIILRDKVIDVLQNRNKSIDKRICDMLSLCGVNDFNVDIKLWADKLLQLERLDESWTKVLVNIKENYDKVDFLGFDKYMYLRQTEYEQLLVYIIYRHFANSFDIEETSIRASFASLVYQLIYTVGAVIWTQNGDFTFSQQAEIVRLFSSEIEYSDENLDAVLENIC